MALNVSKCSQFLLRRISASVNRQILFSSSLKSSNKICSISALRPTLRINSCSTKFYSTKLETNSETEDLNCEKVVGATEAHEFQAETAELLNIVAKSLYSESEVFIREIVSNASDALEKLRYSLLTSGVENETPMEINIYTDKQSNTFTIVDSGIGMTKQELLQNIGTIARSGSKAFLKVMSEKGDANSSIIGQFGVGFYSTFMVGSEVTVFTKSHEEGSKGYKWTSRGGVSYEISEADNVLPGTKIVVSLKPDCREFAIEDKVKQIVQKHSAFVGFPVKLNGNILNSVKPLWTLEARDIDDEQHLNFFQHLSGNQDERFLYKLFYKTDAPLNIRSIFYVGESRPTIMDMTREGSTSGVSLYSRRVLVQNKTEHLMPKWLRFLRGVVDSEDIPLNLSRELLQNSSLIRKLRETLTSRLIRFFVEQSKKDPQKYLKFHENYKLYLTEGVLAEDIQEKREEVAQLLRYESSNLPEGEVTGLKDYLNRMDKDQRNIFYLCAPNRKLAESSPYFEAVKGKNLEVLFCYDSYDEITMLQLKSFDSKQLFSLENEVTSNLYQPSTTSDEEKVTTEGLSLSSTESKDLTEWAKASLDMKVTDVKVTDKLDKHPAMVTVWEMGSVRHYLRSQYLTDPKGLSEAERSALFKPTLQLNSGHPVVIKLSKLLKFDEDLATLVLEQLYDNAMISAGLVDDARPMVNRLNELLSKVLEKH